ncbi:hypothetical protein [Flavobacterium faecale]|uniref:hypothetical protein n=1 Tax=Flavobacterium faecale TaxID=1355330 RepID=UPI003AAC4EB9
MIKKIIEDYYEFSDSWISEIKLFENNNENVFDLIIHCANKGKNYNYEKVKISFIEVIFYKLIGENGISDFAPKDVYIKEEDGVITFDFFPIDHFDYLEENPNSNFIIKCRKIEFKVLK